MEIEYFEGSDLDYENYVREEFKAHRAELRGVDGGMRWVFKREDGTEYILRPESTKP